MSLSVLDEPSVRGMIAARPAERPSFHIDRVSRVRQAKAEQATAELRKGRVTGAEYSPAGLVMRFRHRDAAVCAKALLIDHGVIHTASLYGASGNWRVAGAWVQAAEVRS